jgi:crossover junction endodeoxyribonuclease RuvC
MSAVTAATVKRAKTAKVTAYTPALLPFPKVYPPTARILALDLATQTGWALLANGVLTSGSEGFHRYPGCKSRPAEHRGQAYLNFQRWLRDRILTDKPEAIAYEEPMGHMKSAAATNILHGFRALVLLNAAYYGLPAHGYPQPSVKRFATQRGNATKPEMLAWARDAFGEVEDENQADALAVLHLHLSSQKADSA